MQRSTLLPVLPVTALPVLNALTTTDTYSLTHIAQEKCSPRPSLYLCKVSDIYTKTEAKNHVFFNIQWKTLELLTPK